METNMSESRHNVDFTEVITALLDSSAPFSPKLLHRFSDMDPFETKQVELIWLQVDELRRVNVLTDLEDLIDADTLVNFDAIAKLALKDTNPQARVAAIRLLWESEDLRLAAKFSNMMFNDPDTTVRAAAALALGTFVYEGELEEIPEDVKVEVEDNLLQVLRGPDDREVRRRALESLGFSSREEITPLIEQAFQERHPDWVASALFAMGRSLDSRKWADAILSKLDVHNEQIRLEAVRAAGVLELKKARRPLLELVADPDLDQPDLRSAAIWSLSQIGGKGVEAMFNSLLEHSEDDEEIELLETALENLEFTDNFPALELLDYQIEEGEDATTIIELEDEDDVDGYLGADEDEDEDDELG
jgi:HEAT repeat protein